MLESVSEINGNAKKQLTNYRSVTEREMADE